MPGRHGKQRLKKKKSKRMPVTEMERTLKDSIHGRKRKEKEILKNLIPPLHKPMVVQKAVVTPQLPMFSSPPSTTGSLSSVSFIKAVKKTTDVSPSGNRKKLRGPL